MGDGVERLQELDCRGAHFDSPLVAFLVNHSVRRKMICCLLTASESRLISRLYSVQFWIYSAAQYRREQFVQRLQKKEQIGR